MTKKRLTFLSFGSRSCFFLQLHEILSKEEHQSIMSWLPHGKGFFIHKKKALAEKVLPYYFKESKFTSFTRKLNRWGFTRVTRGPESGAYYHPFFQRGNLRRTLLMTCCQRNSTKKKTKPAALPNSGVGVDSTLAAARMNLGLGSILPGHLGGADDSVQEVATRRVQQLGQTSSALLLGQHGHQLDEQARLELVLRQQQEQLANLEDFRKGQHEDLLARLRGSSAIGDVLPGISGGGQLETASSQYQNVLAQIRASSSRNIALGQQRSLIASQLGASSCLINPFLTAASVAGPMEPSLGASSAARNSLSSAALQSPFSESLDSAMNITERSDPSAYLTMLMAQRNVQAQMNALGQSLSPEEIRAQQALLLQIQQQQLNEFIFQRALETTADQAAGNAREAQGNAEKKGKGGGY